MLTKTESEKLDTILAKIAAFKESTGNPYVADLLTEAQAVLAKIKR